MDLGALFQILSGFSKIRFNLFWLFGKLLGNSLSVSVLERTRSFFADKLLGISHLEGLVVATSYWEICISEVWLLGNSTLEGFESVSLPLL